ncbi:LOW QUALITY PROTEIN: kinesin-like protein Klp59C [Drosophila tropicalis]|uniref:LOW QUALITY PROTEIN: kinesin-like protein Klp59C n=1 Tax=Drosophila tropicalis TaxID=46794 RepID=UPI0035AC081D
MEHLPIGQTINIKRSDGRIHQVIVTSKNIEHDSITTEWTEGKIIRGKEISMNIVLALNEGLLKNLSTEMAATTLGAGVGEAAVGGRLRGPGNKLPPRRNSLAARKTQSMIMTRPGEGGGAARVSENNTKQSKTGNLRCSSVVREVERMKEERERRRQLQAEQRQEKRALMRRDPGNPRWEVALMVRQYRDTLAFKPLRSLSPRGARVQQITVCVRKRPMSRCELHHKNLDVISVPSPDSLVVHELRHKVDLTKFLEHHKFRFDYTFDEQCSNKLVYDHTARPLIRTMFEGGNATCFAYGQTGSGKTHTMGGEFLGKVQDCSTGIYAMAANDVFVEMAKPEYRKMNAVITCSFFEIYGTKVYDLLHPDKPMLRVLEDGNQQMVVVGLTEMAVTKVDDVLELIELGNKERTSGKTSANSKSSRSHAVFQISLYMGDSIHGKCSFVDLAGNERGADTKTANRQTRIEGAEINKSLLALKECIRALSRGSSHLPFRGSKLTQVLRDSFVGGKRNKTCMIAMIAPGLTSVEHTLNTLRYADRVKELIAKDEETVNAPMAEESNDVYEDFDVEMDDLQMEENGDSPRSNFSEAEPDENNPADDGNSIATVSDFDLSTSCDENIEMNPDFSNVLSNNRPPIKLSQVMVQHRVLNEYLENFVRNFKDLETPSNQHNPQLNNYLENADPTFHELITLVTYTRDMILNFNSQRILSTLQADPKTDDNNQAA